MRLTDLIKVNEAASEYFTGCLQKSQRADSYIGARLDRSVSERFNLGYAPRKGLLAFLSSQRLDLAAAEHVGLIGKDSEGKYYEMFRDRIMVPIINAGIIVGFGGRDLGGHSKSKYLNSKTSILYDKSAVLYGLWDAIESIEELGYAILVEGYFDVLGLINSAIPNAVASCGTALKKGHADTLRMFTDSVFVVYDGDEAGKKAEKKARKTLQSRGIYDGSTFLPDNMDPDDYVKAHGKQKFIELVEG